MVGHLSIFLCISYFCRLQAEVAAKRAELAQREQQMRPFADQGPPGVPPGPPGFGGNASAFSTDILHNRQPPMMNHPQPPPNMVPPHAPQQVTPESQPPFQFPPAPGGTSSLSRMSDADLLAAAAAMERPALPPPGCVGSINL